MGGEGITKVDGGKRAAYLVLVEFGLCQTKPPVLFEPSEQSDTSFMCRAQEEGKLWGVL